MLAKMVKWKEGDQVRIVEREATAEDRKNHRYYAHMANLVGTVQNIYAESEIAVRIDPATLTPVTRDVLDTATKRMRERFLDGVSEEQKKLLTKEELEFDVHYMLLCHQDDLVTP